MCPHCKTRIHVGPCLLVISPRYWIIPWHHILKARTVSSCANHEQDGDSLTSQAETKLQCRAIYNAWQRLVP